MKIAVKRFLAFLFSALACQISIAQPDKAIDSLKNVLKTAGEDTIKVKKLNNVSRRLYKAKQYGESKIYAEEALFLAKKLNFRKGMDSAYNSIGMVLFRQGTNFEEALENLEAGLKIAEEFRDTREIANSHFFIAGIYGRMPDADASKQYLLAAKFFEEAGDKYFVGLSYNNLGLYHKIRGNYTEALKYLMAALKTWEEIGDKIGISMCYNNMGAVYQRQGKYPEAVKSFLASLKLKEEFGDKGGLASLYNNIGLVYASQGNYTDAVKNYQDAIQLWEEIKDKGNMANSYINLGSVCMDQGNDTGALNYYMSGKKIYEELGGKQRGLGVVYSLIGKIYFSQDNYALALKSYFTSLNFAREIADKQTIASDYINLAVTYIQLNKHAEARQYLDSGLVFSKEMGAKEGIKMGYEGLSQLDSAMNNFPQALMHYKLYAAYKDSILNETNSKQIAQMKEQFESEKKDKEIVQLESDKQRLESEKQLNALLLKTKQDSLRIVQAENDKVRLENDKVKLENERMQVLNLYNQHQITFLGNEKKIQQLQIEKESADYAVQKAEADKNKEQLSVLNKEKFIRDLQLKKQKQIRNYIIAGLALVVLLFFFVYRNYSTRQKLKLQTLRNKIASDLHDEVGSTLSSIALFSDVAREQSKEVMPMLQSIGDNSRKMLESMADIVWTINPANDNFEKIILRMRSFAFELLGAKKIDFDFKADETVSQLKLSMEARKNLYLIFKEAINNLAKYSEADRASFSIKRNKNHLTVLIRDNGKGFDVNLETSGNGLNNMRKRALEIGAQLFIESESGNGTTIQLILKAV